MHRNGSIPCALIIFFILSVPVRTWGDEPELVEDVKTLLRQFPSSTRDQMHFPIQHEERTDWSYLPGRRKGISFSEMSAEQKAGTHQVLKNVLSSRGYLKVTGIIHLEEILGSLEGNPAYRDPEKYYFTVFGQLDQNKPWAFRFEGHHLSLHFTMGGDQLHSGTPAFFGSNPAVVPSGPYAGKEILAREQRLARTLIQHLDAEVQRKAIFRDNAPRDIVTKSKKTVEDIERIGVSASSMNQSGKLLLKKLIRVYTENFSSPVDEDLNRHFQKGFPDEVYFGWAGSVEAGKPHYYRIHGPKIMIEYDNVQNGANHIHSVIRHLEKDFGRDLLTEHYENSSHHDR